MTFEKGLCHRPENNYLDWFSEDPQEIELCKKICHSCPIRFNCAQTALDSEEMWGIWGGMDDFKVRRAYALDIFGTIRKRTDDQYCPFCLGVDITYSSKKQANKYSAECSGCGIVWKTYVVPSKIRKVLERKYGSNMGKFVADV